LFLKTFPHKRVSSLVFCKIRATRPDLSASSLIFIDIPASFCEIFSGGACSGSRFRRADPQARRLDRSGVKLRIRIEAERVAVPLSHYAGCHEWLASGNGLAV